MWVLLVPTNSPCCGLHASENHSSLLYYAPATAFCHWPRYPASVSIRMKGWGDAIGCNGMRHVAQLQPLGRRRLIFSLATQPRRLKPVSAGSKAMSSAFDFCSRYKYHVMASSQAPITEPNPDVSQHNTTGEPTAPQCVTGSRMIKFARFKNATLELFEAPIESTDYVAFSHVWGEWTWRSIEGIPYEVKASEEKAEFIANDLPALVGDGAFWMDTLTVDQKNANEVSEIVDAIPDIFRMAKKTIAVKECDGLYDCCIAAVNGFKDFNELTDRFIDHSNDHVGHLCAESYLQRLWTLQECLLSHTIEFVIGSKSMSQPFAS